MRPPPGFEALRVGRVDGFARPEAVDWVRRTLEAGATLHEAASAGADGEALQGRGPVPVIPVDGERWAVRHYFRGGAVASTLVDRYLRVGPPRPWAEARRSVEAERRGVPTPRVVAGAVYPAGAFYRADLATDYVPDARDLAAVLFDDPTPAEPGWGGPGPELREEALEVAGRLIVLAAEAGVYHTDLNAKNVLLTRRDGELAPLLLDLDRCRVDVAGPGRVEEAMLARLERSLRKLGQAAGRPLSGDDVEALRRGVLTGGPVPGA